MIDTLLDDALDLWRYTLGTDEISGQSHTHAFMYGTFRSAFDTRLCLMTFVHPHAGHLLVIFSGNLVIVGHSSIEVNLYCDNMNNSSKWVI